MSAPAKSRQAGLPAFELLEEAVQLLRRAPAAVLVTYYLGAVPFVLALLYFWADMSRGALAGVRCAGGALLLALAFVWMKVWQSLFAARLRAQLTGGAAPPWTAARLTRLAIEHAALHAPALFAAPLLPLVIIAPEAFGFLQNLTVLADGEPGGLRAAVRRAGQQAALWPLQQRTVQIVCLLFGLAVFVNLAFAIQLGPFLLKTLFGVETTFTRGGSLSVLNTTFFATAVALAWLCLDPLLKAVYVLRCFYGQSLSTGEDLKVEIRRARQAPGWLGTALALLLIASATAAEPPPSGARPPTSAAVPAADLSQSIERTLNQPEFAWRLPRDKAESLERGWLRQFMEDTVNAIGDAIKATINFIERAYEKEIGRAHV